MNDDARLGGWEQSSLRSWMADELPELLPSELVSNVVAVDKLTNNAGAARDASAITATSDTFWVPSMSELCGYQGPETFSEEYAYLNALYSSEGNQYQLFYELGISGLTANERLVRRVDGQPVYWWERTPSTDGSEGAASTAFNRIMADGDAFDGATPATRSPRTRMCSRDSASRDQRGQVRLAPIQTENYGRLTWSRVCRYSLSIEYVTSRPFFGW